MAEKRIDPEDGAAYTLDEILEYYRGKYKKKVVLAYWWSECTPVKTKKAARGAKEKAKPEPKANAKAKAKAKSRPKSKGNKPANPKRFVNEPASIVTDCLDGLTWTTPNLARLDTYPDIKVVFRTDWDKSKVAIISVGGAGHEPMHGGFVGKGMLTAAVSGETFASPSVDAVLSAIVQVTGSKGCLLVIKNYTGDRLNFALAAQRAKTQFGLDVEFVITKDDVATVAERGIAGALLVHTVAGALAEEGKSLAEVKAAAEAVIAASASMGVSFSVVKRLKSETTGLKKMEVGLGIHGEPGARTEVVASANKVVDIIREGIMAGARMKDQEAPHGYACLINSLGNVPPQEMCIVAADMKSKWASTIKLLVGPALLCTSLDMNGVSLSLLRLTPEFSAALTADTSAGNVSGSEVHQHSVRVKWAELAHDGGPSRELMLGGPAPPQHVDDDGVVCCECHGDTVYRFAVSAVNDVGESEKRDPCPGVRAPGVPPFAPGKPYVSCIRQYSVKLSWFAPGKNGGRPISGYKVFQRVLDAGEWDVIMEDTETDATEIVVTGLDGNMRYEFAVAAINHLGVGDVSAPSDGVQTLPIPPCPPAAPIITRILADCADLKWTAPIDGGQMITKYSIEMRTADGHWTTIKSTALEFDTIGGLSPLSTYSVRLRAANEIGISEPGAFVIFRTLGLPSPPASSNKMLAPTAGLVIPRARQDRCNLGLGAAEAARREAVAREAAAAREVAAREAARREAAEAREVQQMAARIKALDLNPMRRRT